MFVGARVQKGALGTEVNSRVTRERGRQSRLGVIAATGTLAQNRPNRSNQTGDSIDHLVLVQRRKAPGGSARSVFDVVAARCGRDPHERPRNTRTFRRRFGDKEGGRDKSDIVREEDWQPTLVARPLWSTIRPWTLQQAPLSRGRNWTRSTNLTSRTYL